jgi:NAD+ synthase (glutamine-hydrolysing)
MRVALCQFNPLVGAISQNAQRILNWIDDARKRGAKLVVFPELALCGYLPKDIIFVPEFMLQVEHGLEHLAKHASLPCLIGAPQSNTRSIGQPFLNAAFFCCDGEVKCVATKRLLPNYDVFDERRYFEPGAVEHGDNLFHFEGVTFGVTICEDAWNDDVFWPHRRYAIDPVSDVVAADAQVVLNIAASPFSVGKPELRESVMSHLAKRHQRPLLAVGQVGANDQIIFDGTSSVFDAQGDVLARAKAFEEGLILVDVDASGKLAPAQAATVWPMLTQTELMAEALVLGIRDYVGKCKASGVLLGLSGGVDSAVVAALAVRALGAERVVGVALPSRFSSKHSLEDAQELARNLKIELLIRPIESVVDAFRETLGEGDKKRALGDTVDQNLQARARGVLLMALSNAGSSLVLATGNKSELAVGYATLYGDMCGALAPLADVYKTDVWRLAQFLNANGPCIPERTIRKAPSAELKADQTDQDSLPSYDLLDAVLSRYVDLNLPLKQIVAETGMAQAELERIVKLVHFNDYKRQQAPVILKVSERVFGAGWRWPIAKGFDPFA